MSSALADRNLLFGILAVQMDFVSRDALIAAMNAWVLDKTKPLGEIMRALGHLSPERLHLLNALVAEHLQAHHGDPQRSLAALPPAASVRQALEEVEDADVHECITVVSAGDSVVERTTDYRPGPAFPSEAGPRYRILRPHAKGGLGEVFVAEDTELHREVALKEIQEQHADHPHSRGRFVLEAEITGGLEHPGIVPVYGLGQYDDGRPYYAMRFIKGDNYHEAIRRFHAADKPGRDPGERSLALRGLLRRFLDSCNALAYAHSRGVLHRDVKPGNIMLGKYGETLVVDWGLAKLVGRPAADGDALEATLQSRSGSGEAATAVAALAVGTVLIRQQQMHTQQAKEAAEQQRDRAERNFDLANHAVEDTITKMAENPLLKRADFHDLRKQLLASAVPYYQEFAQQQSEDPALEAERGRAHSRLDYVRAEIGETEEAVADYREGEAIFVRLESAFPDQPAYRRDLVRCHNLLGNQLRDLGRRDAAEKEFRAGLALEEKLAEQFPAVPAYALNLGGGYINFGILVREHGQPAAALLWFDKAIVRLQAVLAKDRRLANARLFLRDAHRNRAVALTQLNRHAEAIRDWDRAIELDEGSWRNPLRLQRAICLARVGEHARAVAEVNALTEGKNVPGSPLYSAACVCALAAASAKDDAKLSEQYAGRAMALLRQAQKAGFFKQPAKIAHMKKDDDLRALRTRPDYGDLLKELETPAKP